MVIYVGFEWFESLVERILFIYCMAKADVYVMYDSVINRYEFFLNNIMSWGSKIVYSQIYCSDFLVCMVDGFCEFVQN